MYHTHLSAELGELAFIGCGYLRAKHLDRTTGCCYKAVQAFLQRGLARTIGAQQHDRFAFRS